MRAVAIDDPGFCLFVTQIRCANIAERIEVLLGVQTLEDPKEHCISQEFRFLPRILCNPCQSISATIVIGCCRMPVFVLRLQTAMQLISQRFITLL